LLGIEKGGEERGKKKIFLLMIKITLFEKIILRNQGDRIKKKKLFI